MMFSELASVRLDGAKQAALLLHSLAPADRNWVMSQLDAAQHGELQPLVAELDDMGLPPRFTAFKREALVGAKDEADGTSASQLQAAVANAVPSNPALQSDTEYLMALGPEGVASLAQVWSVEQPELVAYGLKIHSWPWHASLLERLPVAQRSRVHNALSSMVNQSVQARLAKAILGHMRKCSDASERTAAIASDANASKLKSRTSAAAQPLQFVVQSWKRWTAGLRGEAP